MIFIHYIKLLMEDIPHNRRAGRMTPLNRTLWQIMFYWLGLGCVVGYTLFHPEYKSTFLITNVEGDNRFIFATIATVVFCVCEFMNFMCHHHFSAMEEKMAAAVINKYKRLGRLNPESLARRSYMVSSISQFAIVKEYGFQFVTCADWFYEAICWACFSLVISTVSGYLFVGIWMLWHLQKAKQR